MLASNPLKTRGFLSVTFSTLGTRTPIWHGFFVEEFPQLTDWFRDQSEVHRHHVFADSPATRGRIRRSPDLAEIRHFCANAFLFCPPMLQKWAVRYFWPLC
jgi:hypothetical protein